MINIKYHWSFEYCVDKLRSYCGGNDIKMIPQLHAKGYLHHPTVIDYVPGISMVVIVCVEISCVHPSCLTQSLLQVP